MELIPNLHKVLLVIGNSKMTLRIYSYILTITLLTSCNFKSADDYLKEGHDIGLTGNYKAAIQSFTKAIQKNPKLKEAYIQRGLCFENIQEDSLAINDYEKLLRFDANNTIALYYLGLCKYRHNKFEQAIDFYNKALVTKGVSNPSDTSRTQFVVDFNQNGILAELPSFDVVSYEIFYERGLAYYSTGQIQRAYYDFENCINQKYNLGSSNYMVGLCWLAANKRERACESFRQGSFYGDSLSIMQIREQCK